MTNTVRVLLVEDNPGDVGLIRAALDESPVAGFEVDSVSSVGSCRSSLDSGEYDVLLLDYSLPGENGLDFLRSASGKKQLPPVIMLTGFGDEFIAKEAIRSGALDYYAKGSLTPDTLSLAIMDALEKARLAAEERRQREELDKRAVTDPLTGLYNRAYLTDALERECRRAKRYGSPISCLMLDLDGFKECNDKYGHAEGDSILCQVAAAISHSIRDIDIAARYGADEFCLLLPETGLNGALQLAERLRLAIGAMELIAGRHSVTITASLGVFSPATMNQLRPATLMEHANAALRKAKLTGKDRVCEYSAPTLGVA